MASRAMQSASIRHSATIGILALTGAALVATVLWARDGQSSADAPGSAGPVAVPVIQPLPLPDANYVGTPVDSTLSLGISADEAVAIARANPSHLVGTAPLVQLMNLRHAPLGDPPLDALVWVILSDDVFVPIHGPIDRPEITPVATYAWVIVDTEGNVLQATANTYLTPESVPELPAPTP